MHSLEQLSDCRYILDSNSLANACQHLKAVKNNESHILDRSGHFQDPKHYNVMNFVFNYRSDMDIKCIS